MVSIWSRGGTFPEGSASATFWNCWSIVGRNAPGRGSLILKIDRFRSVRDQLGVVWQLSTNLKTCAQFINVGQHSLTLFGGQVYLENMLKLVSASAEYHCEVWKKISLVQVAADEFSGRVQWIVVNVGHRN